MLQPALRFIVFTCIFASCFCMPGKFLGPGEVIFKSFEHCDPPVTEIDMWLTHRKFNRTTSVIDLTLSSPWPLSDDIIMEVKTATKKDGGYKPGSFYLKGPFCTTLKKLVGDVFYSILDATGAEDCPIPGSVRVEDFYLDSDKLNDQCLYGDYKVDLKFFIKNELKGCYLVYLNIVPKE